MAWHRKNSKNASFTNKDASLSRPVYAFTSTEFRAYYVVQDYGKGVYGKVRCSKDVTFDDAGEYVYWSETSAPVQNDFTGIIPEFPSEVVHEERTNTNEVVHEESTSTNEQYPPRDHAPVQPSIQLPAPLEQDSSDIEILLHQNLDNNIEDIQVYWYKHRADFDIGSAPICFSMHAIKIRDPRTPKCYRDAIRSPVWAAAIDKELTKFEVNHCLHLVPYTGQHKVPMMWLFSIKTNGTYKARLVVRGDQMLPYMDYDPNAVYCGNVSACSIKIVLSIASAYHLEMKGADIIGAYLVTKSNPNYRWYINTPEGYSVGSDYVIEAVGNIYGAPPAGQNFSKEFDKCVEECGYRNTPWDLKLFFKWIDGQPLILMAHSDDFRWFGPNTMMHEWDLIVATFNKHKYEITDASDKEFVDINIYHDEEYDY